MEREIVSSALIAIYSSDSSSVVFFQMIYFCLQYEMLLNDTCLMLCLLNNPGFSCARINKTEFCLDLRKEIGNWELFTIYSHPETAASQHLWHFDVKITRF